MSKFAEVIKWINIGLSLFLIAIGIYYIVTLQWLKGFYEFFSLFLPVFFILFGIMLIAAEFQKEVVTEYFLFLKTLLGRGVFNIFLASITVGAMSSEIAEWVGFVYGLMLFLIGILYICLHFFSGSSGKMAELKEELATH